MATFNPTLDNKVHLSNYNYNKGILFDEKKKRFVDFADMNILSYKNYNSPFRYVNKYLTSDSIDQIILEVG
jgi:hypothetical protein